MNRFSFLLKWSSYSWQSVRCCQPWMRIPHGKWVCWSVPAQPPSQGHITVTFLLPPMPWRPAASQLYGNKSPDHKPLIPPSPTPEATTYTLFGLSHDFSSHLLTMYVTQIYKQEEEETTRDCCGSGLLGWARDACSTRAVPMGTHCQARFLSPDGAGQLRKHGGASSQGRVKRPSSIRKERSRQARPARQSHSHLGAFFTAHIRATHWTGWLHGPTSPSSHGQKKVSFFH